MKIVYVAHPISGDVAANLNDLKRILRKINLIPTIGEDGKLDEIVPCAPYFGDCVAMNDSVPAERDKGVFNDQTLILSGVFDELWLTGDKISSGMQAEINLFQSMGKPVVNYVGKL